MSDPSRDRVLNLGTAIVLGLSAFLFLGVSAQAEMGGSFMIAWRDQVEQPPPRPPDWPLMSGLWYDPADYPPEDPLIFSNFGETPSTFEISFDIYNDVKCGPDGGCNGNPFPEPELGGLLQDIPQGQPFFDMRIWIRENSADAEAFDVLDAFEPMSNLEITDLTIDGVQVWDHHQISSDLNQTDQGDTLIDWELDLYGRKYSVFNFAATGFNDGRVHVPLNDLSNVWDDGKVDIVFTLYDLVDDGLPVGMRISSIWLEGSVEEPAVVPLPTAALLFASGLAALVMRRRVKVL